MAKWVGTDATFYPSPKSAMESPPEKLAYVALLKPDALAVVDLDPDSKTYGQVINQSLLPGDGEDELPFRLECLQLCALSNCLSSDA